METLTNDISGDCQAAAADSTTSASDNYNDAAALRPSHDETQVSSTTTATVPQAAGQAQAAAHTAGSPPASSGAGNANNNSKLKSQQQQQLQQQQQQQHHQFRAPQQFVKHKKSTSSNAGAAAVPSPSLTNNNSSNNNKKNKTWNKRQNKTAKQQQNTLAATNAITGGASGVGGAQALGGSSGGSGSGGPGALIVLPTAKADLENIQNLKNQLGGGGGHHYYHHHHHHGGYHSGGGGGGGGGGHRAGSGSSSGGGNNGGVVEGRGSAAGNGLPPPAALSGLDKLGYGHGHLKQQQQLYKKIMLQRGHHPHVLCAGAAHNTLGGGGGGSGVNAACCLVNGCNGNNGVGGGGGGQNGKDTSTGSGGVGAAISGVNCCGRAKFFLSDKRPRKEAIIPPTKFLLGGNISDPLNLNSLQNEASNASSNNNTPATTPRQSPITTPPKVEVIIPPNIHDPLHLLDPVDSMEYEKQLTSPMKRGGGGFGGLNNNNKSHKHRNRKNRKRRRYESYNSSTTHGSELESIAGDTSALANSTATTEASALLSTSVSSLLLPSANTTSSVLSLSLASSAASTSLVIESLNESGAGGGGSGGVGNNLSAMSDLVCIAVADSKEQQHVAAAVSSPPKLLFAGDEVRAERNTRRSSPLALSVSNNDASAQQHVATTAAAATGAAIVITPAEPCLASAATAASTTATSAAAAALIAAGALGDMLPRERASRDLRLELNLSTTTTTSASSSTCGSNVVGVGGGTGGGGGRKRKISESNNSQKNKKFHRLDSMDKIVSPVVPQPGAWKRPPRLVPSGARKPNRRSTSISETELVSPVEEVAKILQLEADSLRVATPELSKMDTAFDAALGSPLSTTSGATSVAAGEQESLPADASADNSMTTQATAGDDSIKAEAPSSSAAIGAIAQLPTTLKMPNFRADGAKYRYGNYDRYTGFRQLNEFMDVRLQVFRRHLELFQNKDILDIGCNVGHMTITVARNLAPKSILGIDIDKELVTRARRNLAMFVRIPPEVLKKEEVKTLAAETAKKHKRTRRKKKPQQQQTQTQSKDTQLHGHHHAHHPHLHPHHHHHHHHHQHQMISQQQQQLHVQAAELFPVAFPLSYGGIPNAACAAESASPTSSQQLAANTPGHPSNSSASNAAPPAATIKLKNEFPRNVFFRQTNYVLKDESLLCNDSQQYDLILCLSLTKWIHLNFGDAGLKLAFKRMFNQLRPGGKLILEAQNWASYKKKKNLTPEIYNNYHNIEFFPNKFHEYLLSSEVGFSHSYTLGVPRHLNKGFCRPIQLYAKGDYTPNHVRWSDAYYPQTPYEAYRGIYATMPPRPAGMAYPMSSTRSQAYDTPHFTGGASSGPYSCRQTPMHQPTSQYYNPLETDSYLPSYDIEYLNHMYVFASPLYQTVWSPPASLRNSSSHTPLFGSVREAELDGDGSGGGGSSYHRHVYPPNDDTSSPNANAGGAFSSIRDPDTDDSNQLPASSVQHVYATNCGESSSSPQVNHHDSDAIDAMQLLLEEDVVASSQATSDDLADA